jgi:uncharacterized phiE125 gp8 family phage protein
VAEPVTLAEAKAQVNMVSDNSQDTFLTSLLAPARAYVERVSRFFWVAASRQETFVSWGDDHRRNQFANTRDWSQYLEIYRRPIASVDTISYVDETGADAAYTSFLAPLGAFPLRIYPAIDSAFPVLGRGGTITVSYTSGALNAASEEYLLGKRAMLLLIGHWFEHRESVIADTRAVSVEVQQTVTDLLAELRPVSAY